MAIMKAHVLCVKTQDNTKDITKPHHFVKLLDLDSTEGAIAELYVKKAIYDQFVALRGKVVQLEVFIDGKYTNVGLIKAS